MGERGFRRLEALANLLMYMMIFLGGVFVCAWIETVRPTCKESLHVQRRPEEISINLNAGNGLTPKTASKEITPSDHIRDATKMVTAHIGILTSGSQSRANPQHSKAAG